MRRGSAPESRPSGRGRAVPPPGAHEPRPGTVGLVLSGGGARSSFQVGALRYLYDRAHLAPDVITGTSAGSILAAVLAQSGDAAGQRRSLADLERLWRGMRTNADMFAELPWFTRLRERGPVWIDALARRQQRQGALGRSFARVAAVRPGRPAPVRTAHAGVGMRQGAGPAGWTPATVLEQLAAVRDLGRAGTDIELILRGAAVERSMYRPGALVEALLDPAVFDPARVATSGVVLRLAVVGLESGELHFVTEAGALVDREDAPILGPSSVNLPEAIRASCAIPMVVPPVPLGGEHYVDGGVRESLPVEIALRLGVERCYAVVAGQPGLARQESFADRDMLAILLRSTAGIMAEEVQRDEVAFARAAGATVIGPEVDVHDSLTITPGLIALAIDYGYLRAADVCTGASAAEQALTAEIIGLRRRIWQAEEESLAPGSGDPSGLKGIAGLKRALRDLLARVPDDRLPPGAQDWWRTWEAHAFEVPLAPAWVQTD
jgi:NTE family protein